MDLTPTTVRQAVKTLLCLPRSRKQNLDLVSADERIELTMSLKKIPIMKGIHTGRFVLPHSLFNADSNVCLFVKDDDFRDRDFSKVKEKYLKDLKAVGIEEIKEVMPLKQLKLEFKPFEAKRRLSDAFDGYISDERIHNFLRPLLGKFFYERHRVPVTAKMNQNKLETAIKRALKTSLLTITPRGPCSMMPIGVISVNSEDDIVENIMSAWKQMEKNVPGGCKNIRSLSIKTAHSKSVPVFFDMDYDNNVTVPDLRPYTEEPEPEEIDTVSGAKVLVYPDGRTRLIRKPKKEEGEDASSEDEDDRLIQKLIEKDEAEAGRQKRRLERRAKGGSKEKKPRRPLLEARVKAEKALKKQPHKALLEARVKAEKRRAKKAEQQ